MSSLPELLPALSLGLALGVQAAARRPNVLVILTDDQRWDALGDRQGIALQSSPASLRGSTVRAAIAALFSGTMSRVVLPITAAS